MRAKLYHLQINVKDPKVSFLFYKKLFSYLEYKVLQEEDDYIGFTNSINDFWLIGTESKYADNAFHRKNTGLNHIAFKVDSKEKVDEFYRDFLIRNNIATIYNSPKLFPEYSKDYYAVYFEDPDRVKIEIVYTSDRIENSKEFFVWHRNKTELQENKIRPFFHEAEVWSCALGLNIGFEQDGRGDKFLRPVVIIKKFNNEVFWGIPLTTTKKTGQYYFPFNLNGEMSTAILSQIRLIDGKRLQYKMGNISKEDFSRIRKHLTQLLV